MLMASTHPQVVALQLGVHPLLGDVQLQRLGAQDLGVPVVHNLCARGGGGGIKRQRRKADSVVPLTVQQLVDEHKVVAQRVLVERVKVVLEQPNYLARQGAG